MRDGRLPAPRGAFAGAALGVAFGAVLAFLPLPLRAAESEIAVTPVRFQLQGIVLEKSTALTAADVDSVAMRWRGKWIGGYELYAIQRELTELYEQRGFRGSGAVLGDQAVEGGVVRFHAREVRIGEVRVEPTPRWLWPFMVRDMVWPDRGALLNVDRLQDRLSQLRESPHLSRIDADLSIGADNPSSATLSLAIEEPPALSVWAMAANNRNPGIGSVRKEIGIAHRSLLGLGDSIEIRRGRTEGLEDSAWSYAFPVPLTRFTLNLSRNKGDSRAVEPRVFKDLDIAAISDTRSIGLSAALWRTATHTLGAGWQQDRRESSTSLLGFPFSFTAGIADGQSRVRVDRVSADYAYRAPDRYAALRVLASRGTVSPQVDIGVPGAVEPAFRHAQLGFSAGRGFDSNAWEVRARVDAQFTHDTLAPVERLSFGGVNGVRGFRENLFLRDRGAIARLELSKAPWEPAAWLKVTPSVFTDAGWGRDSVRRVDGFPSRISSSGLALDLRIARHVRVTAAYARPHQRAYQASGNAQDRGIHLSAGIYYP